jgi:predicted methyltransferase
MAKDSFFPATAMPDRDWWAALWPDPEGVLRSLGVEPGMAVVDLCCGDGYFTAPLAQIVEGEVYGVDIDPAMLEQARTEVERVGSTVLDLICADARDLSNLLPRKVDYVLIANTFHGVPEKTAMARAVTAVLNPGGQFAIVNWHPLPREQTVVLGKPRGPNTEMRMSPDDVRQAVEPAGFALERVVELPPFHYGAVFRVVEATKAEGEL